MSRYDISKFKSPPDEEFLCGICKNVLDTPRESPCRHVFCECCITQALKEQSKCPICRRPCKQRHLRGVLPLVQNLLNKLPMICDQADIGCEQIVPLEHFSDHLLKCGYVKVECTNPSCCEELFRKDSQNHETKECQFRLVGCVDGCQTQVKLADIESHDCLATVLALNADLKTENQKLTEKVAELTSIVSALGGKTTEDKDHSDWNSRYRSGSESESDTSVGSVRNRFRSRSPSERSHYSYPHVSPYGSPVPSPPSDSYAPLTPSTPFSPVQNPSPPRNITYSGYSYDDDVSSSSSSDEEEISINAHNNRFQHRNGLSNFGSSRLTAAGSTVVINLDDSSDGADVRPHIISELPGEPAWPSFEESDDVIEGRSYVAPIVSEKEKLGPSSASTSTSAGSCGNEKSPGESSSSDEPSAKRPRPDSLLFYFKAKAKMNLSQEDE